MRIEAAPAVGKSLLDDWYITQGLFFSLEAAQAIMGDNFIAWPASWDATKGVWYWESEQP